jgi:hypothetical protein
MRGHQKLVAMRMVRRRPTMLYIQLLEDTLGVCANWQEETPYRAHVEILDTEPLSMLDLRFCIGMTVIVFGDKEQRVKEVSAAVMQAGAARCVSAAAVTEVFRDSPKGIVLYAGDTNERHQ